MKTRNLYVVTASVATMLLFALIIGCGDNGNDVIDCCLPPDIGEPPSRSFTETEGGLNFEMVFVEGGTFTMGCTDDECNDWELPTSSVTVSDFYIGKFEVTQKLWYDVTGISIEEQNELYGHGLPGAGDNYPMYYVNWNDIANDFLPALNALTGKNYRLPTEAEWEYAARGGANGTDTKFAGSNNIRDVAWCSYGDGVDVQPIGTKQPNELGVYDMTGNVWEWVHDWYGRYTSDAKIDPTGPVPELGDDRRVYRGGGFGNTPLLCRIAYRSVTASRLRMSDLGFRLALSVE